RPMAIWVCLPAVRTWVWPTLASKPCLRRRATSRPRMPAGTAGLPAKNPTATASLSAGTAAADEKEMSGQLVMRACQDGVVPPVAARRAPSLFTAPTRLAPPRLAPACFLAPAWVPATARLASGLLAAARLVTGFLAVALLAVAFFAMAGLLTALLVPAPAPARLATIPPACLSPGWCGDGSTVVLPPAIGPWPTAGWRAG